MFYSLTMWTVLTSFLVCTSMAYSSQNSFPDYESPNLGQYSESHKGSRGFKDPRWTALEERSNYPYDKNTQGSIIAAQGNILDLNSWPESDSVTLSRQLFGDKAADSMETMRSREDVLLDEEDLPKNKRESHSLSIVNPLDVLRQRLMLEMARRRMKENQEQIRENAVILKNLGKRSASTNTAANTDIEGAEGRRKQDYLRRIQISNSENFEV